MSNREKFLAGEIFYLIQGGIHRYRFEPLSSSMICRGERHTPIEAFTYYSSIISLDENEFHFIQFIFNTSEKVSKLFSELVFEEGGAKK